MNINKHKHKFLAHKLLIAAEVANPSRQLYESIKTCLDQLVSMVKKEKRKRKRDKETKKRNE